MHHYEFVRSEFTGVHAHLASQDGEVWSRWSLHSKMRQVDRHEAALILANWRQSAREDPDHFRLYRRA